MKINLLRSFPLLCGMFLFLLFQQNCIKDYDGLVGFRCTTDAEKSPECGGRPCRNGRCGACTEDAHCTGGEVCCVPEMPNNADPSVRYCRPAAQCSGGDAQEATPEEPSQLKEQVAPEATPEPRPEAKICNPPCSIGQFCCGGLCKGFLQLDQCPNCSTVSDCSVGELCCELRLVGGRCLDQSPDDPSVVCRRDP